MIGVLDPAVLLPRESDRQLADELDELLRLCRVHEIELLELEEYWPQLWATLGRSLDRDLVDLRAKRALTELRKRGRAPNLPPPSAWRGKVYGFRQLFDPIDQASEWTDRMTRALVRATSSGRKTVLLVRRMPGRNVIRHASGHSSIDEPTRWVVRVHVTGAAPIQIPCVHHHRNLQDGLHWTTRFDWRLPSEADGASFPFCPPAQWWLRDVEAVRTAVSKPAWVDQRGNYWCRPNIPGGRGYHWDLHITDPNTAERIGLSQINIAAFGGPPSQGSPGSIHHTPGPKQGRLRDDSGWSCS